MASSAAEGEGAGEALFRWLVQSLLVVVKETSVVLRMLRSTRTSPVSVPLAFVLEALGCPLLWVHEWASVVLVLVLVLRKRAVKGRLWEVLTRRWSSRYRCRFQLFRD